jgi:cell division protease FtsH
MDPTLGLVALEGQAPAVLTPLPDGMQFPASSPPYSQQTAREIDCAVRQLVEAAFQKASELLRLRQSVLEEGSRLLLERETLAEDDIRKLMNLADPVPVAITQAPVALPER